MDETNGKADLCILILSYNRPDYLRQAVRSVLGQQLRPKRIIILDNGSKVPVKEHLQAELDQGVEWVGADENHPSIWNFRRAISLADGKYFMMMHDDDRLLPNFTQEMVRFLEGHVDVIAIAANAHVIDDAGERVGGLLCPGEKSREMIFQDQAELVLQYSRSFLPFPSIIYRNGFPQKVPLREEHGKVGDSIFLCQLAKYGKVAYLDQALFEYRVHSGQDSSTWPFEEIRQRDMMFLDMVKGDRKRYPKVRHNLSRFETKQAIMTVLTELLTARSPKKVFKKMNEVRSPLFNPLLIPSIFYADRRNLILLSRKVRRMID
jgi:glycosyltransferase involved in cell wall biosynthesis